MAQKTFFARTSSGLVREFGTLDTLLIASAAVFALTYTILQFPFYYGFNPGANLTLALFITGIPFVLLMVVYWAMGVIMPRSGNDYVWVARIIHPSIGFAWSFLYMFSVFATAYVGGTAAYASGISTALTVWGFLYNSQSLISLGTFLGSPMGGFGLSILITVCFAVLAIAGAKAVRGFLYIAWALAVIGIIVMWRHDIRAILLPHRRAHRRAQQQQQRHENRTRMDPMPIHPHPPPPPPPFHCHTTDRRNEREGGEERGRARR